MNKANVHIVSSHEKICPDLSVAVLAGGGSRRFGTDKALVRLCPDGPMLIERVVEAGRSIARDVFVVGHQRYAALLTDVAVVPDAYPGEGPLGGIVSALRHTALARMLVLACDMPCLSISLLRWMAAVDSRADILIARTDDGCFHPIPGIYRRSILPAAEAFMAGPVRSIQSIFDLVNVHELCEADLRLRDPELGSLFSLNRPDQLTRAQACVSCN